MPNFLILGGMKSGTTALYHYLRQHPQIYLSPSLKESQFFCYEGEMPVLCGPGDGSVKANIITDLHAYQDLFKNILGRPAVGEVGTIYLYIPEAAVRIRHYLPDAKLIAVLRNPVERAYSNYLHLVRDGLEPCRCFSDAVDQEAARIRANWSPHWHYLRVGFYYEQIKRYLDYIERDRLRIYLYDDYQAQPVRLIQDIFRFLEIDDSFVPDMALRFNVSGIPRSRALNAFLDSRRHPVKSILKPFVPAGARLKMRERARLLNLRKAPPLDPVMRAQLVDLYRQDIQRLQELLGRDLSHWLRVRERKNGNGAG